jgi:hypothetical protein
LADGGNAPRSALVPRLASSPTAWMAVPMSSVPLALTGLAVFGTA